MSYGITRWMFGYATGMSIPIAVYEWGNGAGVMAIGFFVVMFFLDILYDHANPSQQFAQEK